MTSELILSLRLDPETFTTIKLNDVNFKNKVKDLKCEIAEKVNLSKESFELIYCGCILEDDETLESCGLKGGVMIYVLKKREREISSLSKYISEDSILQLVSAFKSITDNPVLHTTLQRFGKRPEIISNIISSFPGLHEDMTAIAILQNCDLMAHFTDVDTVRRFAEAHPVLVEAAHNIAVAVHEEAHNANVSTNNSVSNSQPATSSLSLDNLSDDEEMAGDSSQSSDSIPLPPSLPTDTMRDRVIAIFEETIARLQARISDPSSSSTSGESTNSGVVTTEMFRQAMQEASAATPGLISDSVPPILPHVLPEIMDLRRQLAQMHEMGLQDDTLNIQALQFTNGDVQAAIEHVFSGFSNN
ncbi:ubiquitin-like protein 7 [Hylaeus volcanicus]|uniref:ubiquitin-like protein 7 n=1 Tax=Hylaeus volcanicus TaxID=313075 RepID=UPI0023B7D863|nr:ubiquitin-like protein 7 [Hylaeus volcanicus]